jgi:hypothetical protein
MLRRVSMVRIVVLCLLAGFVALATGACQAVLPGWLYNPRIDPADFVATIDNSFYPLEPGTTFVYEGQTADGPERNEVEVTHETKQILGVTCTVVHDRVWVADTLQEETFDWYAQDKDGNVWYFGEDSKEFDENGVVVSTAGSWEAGVDGAKPGIIMEANPTVGDAYRQEYLAGVAEDMGQVLSVDEAVGVPYGLFENVLKTADWSPLEPAVVEQKYFASGVGMILTVGVQGGSDRLELVDIMTE